ncbi:MAG TPA: phosphoribosylformylglycinamidine cyclo-ligase [Syntrophaceae bacterium]|jgi:phosphoribosylformylglycinamidine cyclo-ligase|nr:phosphoribosylformylglycinamidine cyclo-ligase [Syntrophaceae bacterium]
MQKKFSYKDAGVDIDVANIFVEKIKPLIKTTYRKEVMSPIGGFGGLFHLEIGNYNKPVLVSSTDGVGTKLKISQLMDKHDTIGTDLVAMSVNDVVVQGAEPLFFLDYIATGKLNIDRNVKIIEGIVNGCREAGCALIGGETAEMPSFYKDDEYDLAGFCVGVVEADKIVDGSEIRVRDKIIGIASNGIHSNGLSLARKVLLEKGKLDINKKIEDFGHSVGLELLRPTKIYVKSILNLIKNFSIKGIVHITGGGFIDNIPRIVPNPCRAVILKDSWEIPPIFTVIKKMGNIDDEEMFRVFNMGIGMMVIAPDKETPEIMERLEKLGEKAFSIGFIEQRDKVEPSISFIERR